MLNNPKAGGVPIHYVYKGRGTKPLPLDDRSDGAVSIGSALVDLADRLRKLRPSIRDPEAWHVEKSEIEHAIRTIGRRMRCG